jgi:hypothetical protein
MSFLGVTELIVALKSHDNVFVAVDYVNSPLIGYSQSDILNPSNLPMWIPRMHTIMASTVDFRSQDLIRFQDHFAQSITLKSLQLETVVKMKKILDEYAHLNNKVFTGEFMIAHQNKIYDIDSHGLVTEYQYYRALGHLSQVMSAYLHKTRNSAMDPLSRIKKGFEICENYTKTSSFPICVLNTSSAEIEIIYR